MVQSHAFLNFYFILFFFARLFLGLIVLVLLYIYILINCITGNQLTYREVLGVLRLNNNLYSAFHIN